MTRIEGIKKRYEAATKVTWRKGWKPAQPLKNASNNAVFIAYGREDIPRLVEVVEQAELIREVARLPCTCAVTEGKCMSDRARSMLAELEEGK